MFYFLGVNFLEEQPYPFWLERKKKQELCTGNSALMRSWPQKMTKTKTPRPAMPQHLGG